MFNNILVQHALHEQKNVIYYMFDDENGVSLGFKAISNNPIFKDNSIFLSLQNPPAEYF